MLSQLAPRQRTLPMSRRFLTLNVLCATMQLHLAG